MLTEHLRVNMMARHPSAESLFAAALEQRGETERRALLDKACEGDATLRAEVESLLAADDQSGAFMNTRGMSTAPPPLPPAGAAGERIGRYKLLERIGEGGFGVVWMAEQEEPVRRRVALKVIKLGMDTREVVARFEAERQALALMDHPNIASVFDGGATTEGRPYFVMELVKGVPITRFCDERRLNTRERLELFIQVCHAVQHAHQKGVIHRDLKPSNILVTVRDDRPVPKVIDFGVAKATQARLTEKTVFTRFQQWVGTPAYMSPEQAGLGSMDVDTRSDVYSLGVLLYELLTGRTPFDPEALLACGYESILRAIREEEPPKPSTRLSTLAEEELGSVAARRGAEAGKLGRLLRGDLDWIVMKAIEKDRTRRYGTASALARDLERSLCHQPVEATPPTLRYRLGRLVRRNRLAVASVSAIVVTLVGATVVSARMAWVASQARAVATAESEKATRARLAEARQRQRAEASNAESRSRLVRLNVANGERLLDEGDYLAAGAWFAEALALDGDRPDREALHRLRLESALNQSPKLLGMWFHAGRVMAAEFSHDGRRVVTAGGRAARIWDIATGAALTTPLAHASNVMSASFSPDDQHVLTAGRDRARVWNALSGELERELDHAWLDQAVFSPDGRFLATADLRGEVRIWEVAGGVGPVAVLRHTNRPASGQNPGHLAFSGDGSRLLTSSYDANACVWDVPAGRLLLTLPHQQVVRHACFSPDGTLVATAAWEGAARLWNARSGEPLFPPFLHTGLVDHVTFTPDGKWLASCGMDAAVRLWSTQDGSLLRSVSEGRGLVMETVFDASSSLMATRVFDGWARVWSTEDGRPLSPPLRHNGWVTTLRLHPDGRRLLTGCVDGSVRLWDLKPGGLLAFPPPGRKSGLVEWSGLGGWLARAEEGGRLQLWPAAEWPSNELTLPTSNPVVRLFFSRDEQHLVAIEQVPLRSGGGKVAVECKEWDRTQGGLLSAGRSVGVELASLPQTIGASPDGTGLVFGTGKILEAWDLKVGGQLWRSQPHATLIRFLRYSPDGSRVALNCGRLVHVVDALTGQPALPALTNKLLVTSGEFSPDGRRFVSTCSDVSYENGEARVWDAASGKLLTILPHVDGVHCAAFSRDNRRIATGGEQASARVFNAQTGEVLSPHMRHKRDVMAVAFSPDGRLLATGSSDQTARVWDSVTGEAVTPPLEHGASVTEVAFLAEGRYLITRTEDGSRIWSLRVSSRAVDEDVALARLLAGHQVDATGSLKPLEPTVLSNAWRHLTTKLPDEFR